jgi:molecular chaperone DnaJ
MRSSGYLRSAKYTTTTDTQDFRERAFKDSGILTISSHLSGICSRISEACQRCDGSGVETGFQNEICQACGGKGQIVRSQGFICVATTCQNCGGTGEVITHPCKNCRGSGRTRVIKKIKLKIPSGVKAGMNLRLSGEGERSPNGGPPGDLYVQIHVEEHEFFEREGGKQAR